MQRADNVLLRSNIDLVLTMFEDIAFAADGLPGRKIAGLGDQCCALSISIRNRCNSNRCRKLAMASRLDGVAVGGSKDALTDGGNQEAFAHVAP